MTPGALADAARLAAADSKDTRLSPRDVAVHALALRRWKVAITLTGVMLLVYFSFVLGIAFNKAALGSLLAPGLSVGMALGVLVIFTAFTLTAAYAWWANRKYDPALEAAIGQSQEKGS